MRSTALFLIAFALCTAVGWFIYQDSMASTEAEPKDKATETVAVKAVAVERRGIQDRIELVGSLEEVSAVAIRSRVSGYLKSLKFDIGDAVAEGDVVVELDDTNTLELVAAGEAAEKVALAQVDAQVAREQQSEREVRRFEQLAESGVSTAQQKETSVSAWTVAKAELKLEKARLDQARSSLQQTRLALNELKIASPIAGFVAERNAEPRDLARAEDVLMRIVDLSKVRTHVSVAERDYAKVVQGQTATIEVDAVSNRTFPGVVVRKSPVLDQTTRTGRVIIEIENPDSLLRPGMHARVTIVAGVHNDSHVIPDSALQEDANHQFVFIVDETTGTAVRRIVESGIRSGDSVQILSGLEDDERVITLGGRLVQDGSHLEIEPRQKAIKVQAASTEDITRVSAAAGD